MIYKFMKQDGKAVAALEQAKKLYVANKLRNPMIDILLAQYPVQGK